MTTTTTEFDLDGTSVIVEAFRVGRKYYSGQISLAAPGDKIIYRCSHHHHVRRSALKCATKARQRMRRKETGLEAGN